MASVDRLLVRRDSGLVLLLTPPFDRMVPSPGYIKGYVPGVRENGGQYTHAALWVVLAFARLGDGAKAGELLSMINPARRTSTAEGLQRYRAEPYVVAADVYSQEPHAGRGGWTWYTGSASWMYRVALEGLLGVTLQRRRHAAGRSRASRRRGTALKSRCDGRAPPNTSSSSKTRTAHRPASREVELDGVALEGNAVKLVEDGRRHHVRVVMGQPVLPARPAPARHRPNRTQARSIRRAD